LFGSDIFIGIIASVRDGGREADIEEVKNLVLNIIQRPSCLVLLVVSCESKCFTAIISSCLISAEQPISRIKVRGALPNKWIALGTVQFVCHFFIPPFSSNA
jgi:hypothetical protein